MPNDLTMKAWDALNGVEADIYASIRGSMERMIYAKKFEAKVTKNKKKIKVLGYNGAKNKSNGWEGAGNMTIYYVTSAFRELMAEYAHTGKDIYIDLYVVNKDPSSGAGTQKVWFKNVNFDDTVIAKFDIDNTELDEEINFTFDGFEIITSFDTITGE